jgi:hypothetical protein
MLSKNPDNMEQIKSNFAGKTIFVGLDVHKNSWNLCVHLEDTFLRNVHQKPSPKILLDFLHYPGAIYKTAYEAGKFGRFDASILDSSPTYRFGHRMFGGKSCR